MINRTIVCDVCGVSDTEPTPGAGWMGWGTLNGIVLNGVENPCLCPKHLAKLAEYLDSLSKEVIE